MSTVELKDTLIQKINNINDVSFLNALNTILDRKEDVMFLPAELQEEIKASRREIEKGSFFEQETLDKEIEQWFNSK